MQSVLIAGVANRKVQLGFRRDSFLSIQSFAFCWAGCLSRRLIQLLPLGIDYRNSARSIPDSPASIGRPSVSTTALPTHAGVERMLGGKKFSKDMALLFAFYKSISRHRGIKLKNRPINILSLLVFCLSYVYKLAFQEWCLKWLISLRLCTLK